MLNVDFANSPESVVFRLQVCFSKRRPGRFDRVPGVSSRETQSVIADMVIDCSSKALILMPWTMGNKVETTSLSMDESFLVKVETKFARVPSCVNKEVPQVSGISDRITTTMSL
jgi:precorrin-2 methylase